MLVALAFALLMITITVAIAMSAKPAPSQRPPYRPVAGKSSAYKEVLSSTTGPILDDYPPAPAPMRFPTPARPTTYRYSLSTPLPDDGEEELVRKALQSGTWDGGALELGVLSGHVDRVDDDTYTIAVQRQRLEIARGKNDHLGLTVYGARGGVQADIAFPKDSLLRVLVELGYVERRVEG